MPGVLNFKRLLIGAMAVAGSLVANFIPLAEAATPAPAVEAGVTRSDVALSSGRRLSYLEWRTAGRPTLLMLHGKGSTAADSQDLAAALARDYRVIAVDLRGRGFSDWAPDGDYTVEATVDDLVQFARAMQLGQFSIYGMSYGAVVGIALANKLPSQIQVLLLEDGGPTTRSDGSLATLNPGQAAPAGAPTAAPVPAVYSSWEEMEAKLSPARKATQSALEARFVRDADGRVRDRSDVTGIWKSNRGEGFVRPWPLIRGLVAPTLLIRADRGLMPEAIASDMQTVNPRITVVTVKNAGHGVHRDQFDEVLAHARTFLAQHLVSGVQ